MGSLFNYNHFVKAASLILVCLHCSILFISQGNAQGNDFKKVDTSDIILNVFEASQSMESWVESLNQSDYRILCLGETHEDFFREFYGDLLQKIDFKKLAIEAVDEEYKNIQETFKEKGVVDYLNANFTPIMKAIEQKNNIQVFPVEATKSQDLLAIQDFAKTNKSTLYRDGFIASNILQDVKNDEKMVVLYGANHCAKTNIGLGSTPFMNLLKGQLGEQKALSVTILKRQGDKTHPLVSYLDATVEAKKQIRVVESKNLPAESHNFNWNIITLTYNYDFIIIY